MTLDIVFNKALKSINALKTIYGVYCLDEPVAVSQISSRAVTQAKIAFDQPPNRYNLKVEEPTKLVIIFKHTKIHLLNIQKLVELEYKRSATHAETY